MARGDLGVFQPMKGPVIVEKHRNPRCGCAPKIGAFGLHRGGGAIGQPTLFMLPQAIPIIRPNRMARQPPGYPGTVIGNRAIQPPSTPKITKPDQLLNLAGPGKDVAGQHIRYITRVCDR